MFSWLFKLFGYVHVSKVEEAVQVERSELLATIKGKAKGDENFQDIFHSLGSHPMLDKGEYYQTTRHVDGGEETVPCMDDACVSLLYLRQLNTGETLAVVWSDTPIADLRVENDDVDVCIY